MTYEEVSGLKKGTRIRVQDGRSWLPATFCGHGNAYGTLGAWIAYDKDQKEPGTSHQTFVTTGLQFTPEYFKECNMGRKFERDGGTEQTAISWE